MDVDFRSLGLGLRERRPWPLVRTWTALRRAPHSNPGLLQRTKLVCCVLLRFVSPRCAGSGEYDWQNVAKIKGAVKLQKAIRRRQSRGIFAVQESHAREVPSPTKYAPDLAASQESTSNKLESSRSCTPRFEGPGSIYTTSCAPNPAKYADLTKSSSGDAHGVISWNRCDQERFHGFGSHFDDGVSRKTPGVGSYNINHMMPKPPVDSSANPESATFISGTNRFKILADVSCIPAPGHYEVEAASCSSSTAKRVKGAVKLQNAFRRRQSRGIFAAQEAVARQVPSPTRYHPEKGISWSGNNLMAAPKTFAA